MRRKKGTRFVMTQKIWILTEIIVVKLIIIFFGE